MARDETFHGEYQISYTFEYQHHKNDTEFSTRFFEIVINQDYLYAEIIVYPEAYNHYTKKIYRELGRMILHEMCHLYLEPVITFTIQGDTHLEESLIKRTVEQQTQRICNSIFPMLDVTRPGWYMPKEKKEKTNNEKKPRTNRHAKRKRRVGAKVDNNSKG